MNTVLVLTKKCVEGVPTTCRPRKYSTRNSSIQPYPTYSPTGDSAIPYRPYDLMADEPRPAMYDTLQECMAGRSKKRPTRRTCAAKRELLPTSLRSAVVLLSESQILIRYLPLRMAISSCVSFRLPVAARAAQLSRPASAPSPSQCSAVATSFRRWTPQRSVTSGFSTPQTSTYLSRNSPVVKAVEGVPAAGALARPAYGCIAV